LQTPSNTHNDAQNKMKKGRLFPPHAYTVAFGVLAALVGVLAGGPILPMLGLGATFASLYLLAERCGWLLADPDGRTGREYAVTGVFAALSALFVWLTGGLHSPMPCTLYLPVLLASLCYGMRLGMAASVLMIGIAAVLAMDGALPHAAPSPRAIGIALSFPVVAIFGGALRAQMEGRLRALDGEKKDLSAQLDMSQMMESAFDLDMTLNLILLNVYEHTGCEICAVYLVGADQKTLELRSASGPRDRTPLLPALAVADARTGGWDVSGAAHYNQDVRGFYAPNGRLDASRLSSIDAAAGSFACLPLVSLEGLLGMLYVSFPHAGGLTPEGLRRLEQLALRAAYPLQRVLLQQGFRSLAYSDPMTGLDNFRQFEETLAEELARAERYDRPLSVILLDIDHFKSFNDTLGHQAGDALLGQLGVVLRNSLRNVDRPARYGGEEFVVICPETGAEEVRLIAERIRRSVADTPFVLPSNTEGAGGRHGAEMAHVTISLGCVTFPGDARTPRDLVKKADIALYAAKASGRNTVRVYDEAAAQVKAA